MTLILSQPPIAEPITLAELKSQLRLDHANEDDLLTSLISTARQHLEHITGLALMDQSWRLCVDQWPDESCLEIAKHPIITIDLIEQFDSSGQPSQVVQSNMILDGKSNPARLYVGQQSAPDQTINGIEITFTAGFGSANDVPDSLKRAILLHAAHMYEFRTIVSQDMQPASIPSNYKTLIAPWLRKKL